MTLGKGSATQSQKSTIATNVLVKTKHTVLRRVGFIVAAVMVLLATSIEVYVILSKHYLGYDYTFFYYAFEHVLDGNATGLYDIAAQHALVSQLGFPVIPYDQYVYPPQFAVLLSWLAVVPFRASLIIWTALGLLSAILSIRWLAKMLSGESARKNLWLVAVITLTTNAFQNDILFANVNDILFALVVLTFYLLHREKPWSAGIPLGVAIVFKVTPVAVLGYLLLSRQWRTSLSATVTALFISGLTAAITGLDPLVHYAQSLVSFGETSMKNGSAPFNESIIGVLQLITKHSALHTSAATNHAIYLLLVLIVGTSLVVWRRPSLSPIHHLAISSLLLLLFSPLVEQMYFLFAIPAIVLLWKLGSDARMTPSPDPRRTLRFKMVAVTAILFLSVSGAILTTYLGERFHYLFWLETSPFWVMLLLYFSLRFAFQK